MAKQRLAKWGRASRATGVALALALMACGHAEERGVTPSAAQSPGNSSSVSPWGQSFCEALGLSYSGGYGPAVEALKALGLEHRVKRALEEGDAFHDAEVPRKAYSVAFDLSVRCPAAGKPYALLGEGQIKQMLSALARAGFAAWYRKPGADFWSANRLAHVHATYVEDPMKENLRIQIDQWLRGFAGLTRWQCQPYTFWTPDAADHAAIEQRAALLAPLGLKSCPYRGST